MSTRERHEVPPLPPTAEVIAEVIEDHTASTTRPARRDRRPVPPDTLPSPWVPGTRFSSYEIESRLAVGGMAEIWRAKIKGLEGFEKRIVIKTMLPELHHRAEMTEMFAREASLAARLSHPNIVDVLDFGQLEGRYFMAMEYVPGLTLRVAHRTMLACGGRLPLLATLHVLRDVCAALQHLHDLEDANGRMGLLHRDVSPDNVILSTSGAAKLIDFGAARAVARTAPGRLFIGKYRYAAPERIRQQGEDCRSDVYSAGVMLYECLVGRRPFEGSDAEVVRAALSSAACDPCARLPDLAPSVGALVRKATAHDPSDRFASAGDFGAALAACLRELGASSRERDVTDALSTLLETTPGPVPVAPLSAELEAVPEAIAVSSDDSEMALSEREIIEASGPLPLARPADDTRRVALPVPDEAFGSRPVPISARTMPASAPEGHVPTEPGVELFDLGLQLRAEGRYWEALESWEKALALAPGNRLYQSHVQRLRRQLPIPGRASTDDESRPASR